MSSSDRTWVLGALGPRGGQYLPVRLVVCCVVRVRQHPTGARIVTRGQLERAGVLMGQPADEVTLAVADALLPAPLPPALHAFLRVCDGARAGEVEVFGTDRIIEMTNAGAHAWKLPSGTLVVGSAGAGRALVMLGGRDEVDEVDDDPWDVRTVELSADTPLDLFLLHHGVPLRDREPWSTLPALVPALEHARASLTRDVEALIEVGIASRVGEPLPSSLRGVRLIDMSTGARLLASEEYEMFLVNYRPNAPAPGPLAADHWAQACEAIVSSELRDLVRAAPVTGPMGATGRAGDDEMTVADIVRGLAWLALIGKARDDLADIMRSRDRSRPGRSLAQVFLAGHVPVSLRAAI